MTNTINRRQAMAGVAAMAAIPTTATAQTVDPDQGLVDLFDRWRKLDRAIIDAIDKSDSAKFAARAEHPEQPDSIRSKHAISYGEVVSKDDLEFNHEFVCRLYPSSTHDAIETIHNEAVKIYDKWKSEKDRINQHHNVPALEQALADLIAERNAVEKELIGLPSKSVTGVLIKLSFWSDLNSDTEVMGEEFVGHSPPAEDYAIRSAHTDLQRLTGQSFTTTV